MRYNTFHISDGNGNGGGVSVFFMVIAILALAFALWFITKPKNDSDVNTNLPNIG